MKKPDLIKEVSKDTFIAKNPYRDAQAAKIS